jgi:hypothetical protein
MQRVSFSFALAPQGRLSPVGPLFFVLTMSDLTYRVDLSQTKGSNMLWQRFKNSFQSREHLRDYIFMCIATVVGIGTVIFGTVAFVVFL